MSVKSNDGGGGGSIQRGQLLCYKCHCCLVFFWYCMEVPDPMGGIVQSVTPSMPGKLNSTCVLYCFSFSKYTFSIHVSLMYSVEYTYQGSYSGRHGWVPP